MINCTFFNIKIRINCTWRKFKAVQLFKNAPCGIRQMDALHPLDSLTAEIKDYA